MRESLIIVSLILGQALGQAELPPRLDQYTLAKGPMVIGGVSQNASGLTYHAGRDSLFVVLDSPQRIVELGLDGSLKRKINLNKFDDTEGITWLGENRFAVAEEARGNIVLIELEPKDGGVSWKKATKLKPDIKVNATNGLEGIAYDPLAKRFFVAREKRSPAVFKIIPPKPESDTPPTAILMSTASRPAACCCAAARPASAEPSSRPRVSRSTSAAPSTSSASRTCCMFSKRRNPGRRVQVVRDQSDPLHYSSPSATPE
jgi:hypothetical protein